MMRLLTIGIFSDNVGAESPYETRVTRNIGNLMNDCVIGVDLSGPANFADTVLVAFEKSGDRLRRFHTILSATDADIRQFFGSLPARIQVTVGLDAPLSYNPGGGDRPADAELRKIAVLAGMKPGSIMPPTLHRMIYLTVRGISLARGLNLADGSTPRILEVHPGAAMALNGAPIDAVRCFSSDAKSRIRLLQWFETRGLEDIVTQSPSGHYVAACGSALAAWNHSTGQSAWLAPADPPCHPFDYCA